MNITIKKGAAAFVGAVAMLGAAASANAADGQYVNAQLAISDVGSGFNTGVSFVGTLGMPLQGVPHVAIEGEFSKALIKPEYNWFGTKIDVDYYTLAGYGVYNIPANDKINFRLRAGLAYEHFNVSSGWNWGSSSSLGLSVGAGLTVKMSPTTNFIAEYTDIQGDIDHLSAGVQIKF